MKEITVVKIGGKVIADVHKLEEALSSFKAIDGPKILIHGGGTEASDMANKMGISVKMHEGRRITDDAMIEIVMMIYGGKVNKQLVALLQAKGVNAIGLSGADGNTILSERRPVKEIDFGNVGDIKNVNGVALVQLLNAGFIPVFCALTHDGKGQILNTNADTIASEIAAELSKSFSVRLCFTFELDGVLADFKDRSSVIPKITAKDFQRMRKERTINEGMIPKIHNALFAVTRKVKHVYICNFSKMNNPSSGTRIC